MGVLASESAHALRPRVLRVGAPGHSREERREVWLWTWRRCCLCCCLSPQCCACVLVVFCGSCCTWQQAEPCVCVGRGGRCSRACMAARGARSWRPACQLPARTPTTHRPHPAQMQTLPLFPLSAYRASGPCTRIIPYSGPVHGVGLHGVSLAYVAVRRTRAAHEWAPTL